MLDIQTTDSVTIRELFSGQAYRLVLRFTVISDVYRSVIRNKTI